MDVTVVILVSHWNKPRCFQDKNTNLLCFSPKAAKSIRYLCCYKPAWNIVLQEDHAFERTRFSESRRKIWLDSKGSSRRSESHSSSSCIQTLIVWDAYNRFRLLYCWPIRMDGISWMVYIFKGRIWSLLGRDSKYMFYLKQHQITM